jgi:hypothetical protein
MRILSVLEDLANIGELIGGIAVILTLAYLAYQSKQANLFMVRQIRQSVTDSGLNLVSVAIQNPKMAMAFTQLDSGKELNAEQSTLLRMYLTMFIQMLKNNYYHHQSGLITDEDWVGMLAGYNPLIANPFFKELAESMGISRSPDFGRFLQELIEED